MAQVIAGTAPVTDASGHFTVSHVAEGSGSVMFMPQVGSFDQLAKRDYTASQGQVVDLGTIKIVPPRNGDAGTFGLVASPNKDGKLAVASVSPGGPADQAGITTADVITQLDGHPVDGIGADSAAQLLSSGRIAVGQQVALTLERGTTVTLTAAKW
jgi:S1-C subfamily serine protease